MLRGMKASSTNFINESKFCPGKFSWQEGFGCFTHSYSLVDIVAKYLLDILFEERY